MEELSASRPDPGLGSTTRASQPAEPARARFFSVANLARGYSVLSRAIHRTILGAAAHDCLNVAQSTAYSAIVALFPALIFAAAIIGLLPDTAPVRFQIDAFFDRILPPGVSPLLDAALENTPNHTHSVRALISAAVVSLAGASNVIATLMEGFRRAREMPTDGWTFWQRRRRSFELVPLSVLPLAMASLLVVFGHAVTGWLTSSVGPQVRGLIYMVTVLIRWALALGASIGVIALLYRLGTPDAAAVVLAPAVGDQSFRRTQLAEIRRKITAAASPHHWQTVLPGAVMATVMWFLTTLIFGWYVTRFANYSEVYGSLGAGIALLFWLYIISLSVLCGAEFNAQFDRPYTDHVGPPEPAPPQIPENSPSTEGTPST